MTLVLTKHAKEQMAKRAINREQIIRAIKQGAKIRQTDGFLALYGYIKVAYKTRGDKYIIKTVVIND